MQSRCLNLEPVRWNGVVIEYRFAAELAKHVELRSVGPEVGIGLGPAPELLRFEQTGALAQRWLDPYPASPMTS